MSSSSYYRFSGLREFIDPKNLIFIFLNVLIFITVQVVFFWFVASKNFEENALKLADVNTDYLTGQLDEILSYCAATDPENNPYAKDLQERAEKDRERINEKNRERLFTWIIPVIGVLLALFVFFMVFMGLNRERFDKGDILIVFAMIMAFGTEMMYFFLVVRKIYFVGELQILVEMLDPGSTYEWDTPFFTRNEIYSTYNETNNACTGGPARLF